MMNSHIHNMLNSVIPQNHPAAPVLFIAHMATAATLFLADIETIDAIRTQRCETNINFVGPHYWHLQQYYFYIYIYYT